MTIVNHGWGSLQKDILELVYFNSNIGALGACNRVNKHWKAIANDPRVWRVRLLCDYALSMSPLQKGHPKDLYRLNRVYRINLSRHTRRETIINIPAFFSEHKIFGKFGVRMTTPTSNLNYAKGMEVVDLTADPQVNCKTDFPNGCIVPTQQGFSTPILDKNIMVFNRFPHFLLLYRASDCTLLKNVPAGVYRGRISEDTIAYLDESRTLRFFDLTTHQDMAFHIPALPEQPENPQHIDACKLFGNILVIRGREGSGTWIRGYDFKNQNPQPLFYLPSLRFNTLDLHAIGNSYFSIISSQRVPDPFENPPRYGKSVETLLGVYKLENGNKVELEFPLNNITFTSSLANLETPENLVILIDVQEPNVVQLWDVEKKVLLHKFTISDGSSAGAFSCILSRNRLLALTANSSQGTLQKLCLFDIETGQLIKEVDVTGFQLKSIHQGVLCLSTPNNGIFRFIDIADGSVVKHTINGIVNVTEVDKGKIRTVEILADKSRTFTEKDYT